MCLFVGAIMTWAPGNVLDVPGTGHDRVDGHRGICGTVLAARGHPRVGLWQTRWRHPLHVAKTQQIQQIMISLHLVELNYQTWTFWKSNLKWSQQSLVSARSSWCSWMKFGAPRRVSHASDFVRVFFAKDAAISANMPPISVLLAGLLVPVRSPSGAESWSNSCRMLTTWQQNMLIAKQTLLSLQLSFPKKREHCGIPGPFLEVNLNFNIVCRSPGMLQGPYQYYINLFFCAVTSQHWSRPFVASRAGADPGAVRGGLLRICGSRSSLCLHPWLEATNFNFLGNMAVVATKSKPKVYSLHKSHSLQVV